MKRLVIPFSALVFVFLASAMSYAVNMGEIVEYKKACPEGYTYRCAGWLLKRLPGTIGAVGMLDIKNQESGNGPIEWQAIWTAPREPGTIEIMVSGKRKKISSGGGGGGEDVWEDWTEKWQEKVDNRPPEVRIDSASPNPVALKTGGVKVAFSATATDTEKDSITEYEWDFGDDSKLTTVKSEAEHIYANYGAYAVTLKAKDENNNWSKPVEYKKKVVVFGLAIDRKTDRVCVPIDNKEIISASIIPNNAVIEDAKVKWYFIDESAIGIFNPADSLKPEFVGTQTGSKKIGIDYSVGNQQVSDSTLLVVFKAKIAKPAEVTWAVVSGGQIYVESDLTPDTETTLGKVEWVSSLGKFVSASSPATQFTADSIPGAGKIELKYVADGRTSKDEVGIQVYEIVSAGIYYNSPEAPNKLHNKKGDMDMKAFIIVKVRHDKMVAIADNTYINDGNWHKLASYDPLESEPKVKFGKFEKLPADISIIKCPSGVNATTEFVKKHKKLIDSALLVIDDFLEEK